MTRSGSQDVQDRHFAKLPCADGAAFNARIWEHKSHCLPNTRVDLLKQIMTWSNDSHGACIFWLNGVAGTGKSTIARTVARTWSDQRRLGASFFFSKGLGDLGHATKLFTSLITQLAIALPAIIPYVCRAMEENPDIIQRGLGEQWEYLILKPLSGLNEVSSQPQILILVIDALDECEGDADTRLILRLLAETISLNTIRLRVFLTSRPETPIRFGFSHDIPEEAHQDFVLHNISPSTIHHDISVFIVHELRNIQRENGFPEGWPGAGTIELLCQRAHGLFIYAATACRFIRDLSWDAAESLSLILEDAYIGQSPTEEIDTMYTRVLTYSFSHGDRHKRNQKRLGDEFKIVVGSIIILFDSLSAEMLARLLELPIETINVRLRFLHSILDVPKSLESPVRLLHPSFRDFLLDYQRCKDSQLWVDEKKAHGVLFGSCLRLMSKHLKRDMCNLRLPGVLKNDVEDVVKNCLPQDVQYACCYWVNHLSQSNIELCDNDQVHSFLQEHFLHWLEVLSLIGKTSDGVLIVKSLESMLMVSSFI